MNSRLLSFFLFTVFVFFVQSLAAQEVYGRITDARSKEPLAFVAVIEKGTANGIYSDIEGYFRIVLTDKNNPLVFHYVGYEDKEIKWSERESWEVQLVPKTNLSAEVVVLPGVNPAERIIRKAIENKKINNPESDIAFTYDSYNKLVFGMSLDTAILADSAKFAALDTTRKEMYDFFNKQYLFMMESVTQRKFFPPDRSEETIIANRVSGFKSTDLFLLGTQLQSFSFYGETVELLGTSYMSPLANGAIGKYRFEIADTTYIGADTVFTIAFQPKSRKNFSGMKGLLYINTNGYALQNVLAEPYEPGSITIKIRQQYEFVENRKWFPLQLNSTIIFNGVNIGGDEPLVGEGRSYIKNLVLDAPLSKKDFTPVTLLMAPKAGQQPDSVWNKYREHELDKRELKTYQIIDSIGQEIHLDRKLKWFESLSTGLLPIGLVSFDLSKLLRYNDYEGWRLGGGLRTNDKISDKFNIGGYAAYGFRDKQWKYGGDMLVHLYRKRNAWMKLIYENDVMELGGNQFAKQSSGLTFANIYPLFITRMDHREKFEVQLNGRVIRNFSLNVFANQQFIKTYHDYEFKTYNSENLSQVTNQFYVTETGATLRYAPGEKLVRMSTKEVRLGGRYPVFYLRYTKGWNNMLDGQFSYNRYDAMIEKTFKILNVGDLSVMTLGGMVPEDVPFSLLYNAQGSNNLDYKKKWIGIATPGAFETMHTNEFQHSQFVSVHVRHNFKQLLVKREKFRPQFVLVHNMLWGKMDHAESHNYEIKAAEKGYFESGFQIDGLLKSGITSFGVAAFYRYGPYHHAKEIENFAFKLTAAYVF